MKTVGIIVEYNPLHNGHVYHFQQSKIISGADAAVAVMSGSFLQRGEPALVSKWARTEMALRMGADVVIELPVAYSAQPAEWFAFGAVSALDATGVVDSLCFGSESGDIGLLRTTARQLYNADRKPSEGEQGGRFHEALQSHLKSGASYPHAYAAAAADCFPGEAGLDWLAQPNNTLGLHYLLALERLGSSMVPYTISRQKSGYNQTDITDERIASATALRKLLADSGNTEAVQPFVPEYTWTILKRELAAGRAPVSWESFYRVLFTRLAVTGPSELAGIGEVTEGLEHRIKRAAADVDPDLGDPFGQLMLNLKTKRYTRTKLQRAMTRILLHHRKEELSSILLGQGVPYLRVLGFSTKGQALLKLMRTKASVPVITKATAFRHPFLELDIRSATVHASAFLSPTKADLWRDYYEPPIRLAEREGDI